MANEAELKKKIKEKGMDRRELAKKMGVSYSSLNSMLNGFTPLKSDHQQSIEQILLRSKIRGHEIMGRQ
jgi:transcriptional regulator with XRE-family HTH domain